MPQDDQNVDATSAFVNGHTATIAAMPAIVADGIIGGIAPSSGLDVGSTQTHRSELHKAALKFAKAGIPIFPIVPGGKTPATPHSFYDASADPALIETWWRANPYYNIGLCPEAIGLFVVDLDGEVGLSHWAMLTALSELPETLQVRTPSGGMHLYYRGSAPPSVRRLGPGVDVRGKGSYVLLPPSVAKGVQYAPTEGPMDFGRIPEAPQCLLSLTAKPKREPREAPKGFAWDHPWAIEDARDYVRWVIENDLPRNGNRDDWGFKFFTKMHAIGLSPEMADAMAEKVYAAGGARPDSPDDHDDKIGRIWAEETGDNPAGSERKLRAAELWPSIATDRYSATEEKPIWHGEQIIAYVGPEGTRLVPDLEPFPEPEAAGIGMPGEDNSGPAKPDEHGRTARWPDRTALTVNELKAYLTSYDQMAKMPAPRFSGVWFDTGKTENENGPPVLLNSEDNDARRVDDGFQKRYGARIEVRTAPRTMLVPDWMEKHLLSLSEGTQSLGKSSIKQGEGARLQAGLPILDHAVERTGVLYLNYETPEDIFDHRMEAIANAYGTEYSEDGLTQAQWREKYPKGYGHPPWPTGQTTFQPLDLSDFEVWNLRGKEGAHLLRVTAKGKIIATNFCRRFLAYLASRRDRGLHTFVEFDGLIDAIIFEGSTRTDDTVVRELIHLLDRWCVEYDFTGDGILHPSRAGIRDGTGSYAPAWSTVPRMRDEYRPVDAEGKTDAKHPGVITRREAAKRSHGKQGHYVDYKFIGGIWREWEADKGGEHPVAAAVTIALRQDAEGNRIKKDGTIGKHGQALQPSKGRPHLILQEYRNRIANQKASDEHFLNALHNAVEQDKLVYYSAKGHTTAGYGAPC